ncbi:MAG: ABC transporter ATP-binding protein [Clostridia bacterium]|nr:ABC transporter ATP-binding protein [Clostridia bacterium]
MFRLIRYVKGYRVGAVLGPLLKLLEALMETFVPFIMSDIIDVGINRGDTAYVLKRGLLLVFIAVLGWIFSLSAQYFNARASMGFGLNLRTALFDKILSMDMETVDRFTIPSLITRTTTDVVRTQTGLNMFLRLILRNPFIVLGAIIMSGIINIRVMLIYIILVPLISVGFYLTIKFARPFYDRIQRGIDRLTAFCRENIIGVRSVRAFGMQEEERKNFEERTDDLFENQVKADRIAALNTPINTLMVNGCVILVLLIGSSFVNGGAILNGSIIALVNYLFQILLAVERTASLVDSFNKANVSSGRIKEVLDYKKEDSKDVGDTVLKVVSKDPDAPYIRFQNVSFSYDRNGAYSLSDISFTLEKGETLGIIGGTGSGKSTLVNLLQGIYPVAEGGIYIEGVNVNDLDVKELRKYFSVVQQKPMLFAGTIKDNIRFGNPDATGEEIEKAVAAASADEFVYKKEGGLDYKIEYGGRNISGGQKQRLAMARAFVRHADILVLDDSTSALDYVTESKIRKYVISGETMASTKVIVSQRISAVMQCDKIIVLEDGLLKGFGKHGELLDSCDIYKEIYLSQTGDLKEAET